MSLQPLQGGALAVRIKCVIERMQPAEISVVSMMGFVRQGVFFQVCPMLGSGLARV